MENVLSYCETAAVCDHPRPHGRLVGGGVQRMFVRTWRASSGPKTRIGAEGDGQSHAERASLQFFCPEIALSRGSRSAPSPRTTRQLL